MSRKQNNLKRQKAMKRQRQKLDAEHKLRVEQSKIRSAQKASGMPEDVYALAKLLGSA